LSETGHSDVSDLIKKDSLPADVKFDHSSFPILNL
jgi:hypothetical protein